MVRVTLAARRAIALGVTFSLAGVPSGAGVASAQSPSPWVVGTDEPWIVFQQFRDRSTITLVRPDGSGLYSPTQDLEGGDQTNPDWSPDGSRLVFALAQGDRENLWVVDVDGSDARPLATCEGDCWYLDNPAWSPDGRTVLFSRMRAAADGTAVSTLEQADVATGATSVIVEAEPAHFYAGQRWSPDGAFIVLEVVELAGPGVDAEVKDVSLAIIELADPTPSGRELLGGGRFPETAAWAPDGSVIVFGALDRVAGSGLDLFSIAPDGSGLRQLTTLAAEGDRATHPDVAADGTVIFSANLPGDARTVLGRIDLDGGEITPATGASYLAGVHPRIRPARTDDPG